MRSVFCGVCDYCTTGHPVLCQSPDVRIPAAANDLYAWQRPQKLNQFAYLGSFAEQMLVHVDMNAGRSAAILPSVKAALDAIAASHASLPIPQQVGSVMQLPPPRTPSTH